MAAAVFFAAEALPFAEDFCAAPLVAVLAAVVLAAVFFAPPGCDVLVAVFFVAPCFTAPFLAVLFFAVSLIAPPFLALPFAGLTPPLVAVLVAPLTGDLAGDFAAALVEAPLAADCLPLDAALPLNAALPPDAALAGAALVEEALDVVTFAAALLAPLLAALPAPLLAPLPALTLAPCDAAALLLPPALCCDDLPDDFDAVFTSDFAAALVLEVLPLEVFVSLAAAPGFVALLVATFDACLPLA